MSLLKSPWKGPLIILVCLWIVNYSAGLISFEHSPTSLEARDAGAAVVLPMVISITISGLIFLLTQSASYLSELVTIGRKKKSSRLHFRLYTLLKATFKRRALWIAPIGLVLGISYLYSQKLVFAPDSNPFRVLLAIQTLVLWTNLAMFIAMCWYILSFVAKSLKTSLRVELFEVEHLRPVCNLIIYMFLFLSAMCAAYSISTILVYMPAIDIAIISLALLMILFFLLYPIRIIMSTLRKKKSVMLNMVNQILDEKIRNSETLSNINTIESSTYRDSTMSYDLQQSRQAMEEQERLEFVSDLLVIKKEVIETPLWPMGIPFTLKLAFLMILPLISWAGAGVLSQLLRTLI